MNKTLNALSTKLKWQLQALNNKLLLIEQQIAILEQKIDSILQKISSSCSIPTLIIPEQEMARSHFITQQQQHHNELTLNKSALQSEQQALKEKQTHLNIKIKMLDKHQEAQSKSQRHQTMLAEQKNNDEWMIQHRE